MSSRPDYFVSFCLVHETSVKAELAAIAELDELAEKRLQYWEIIYVVGEAARQEIEAAANELVKRRNLRVVLVREQLGYYTKRMIAANEAIGDVVVLSSFGEISVGEVIALSDMAMSSKRVVLARLPSGKRSKLSYRLIGLVSDFRVDARDLKVIALPRDALSSILTRPTAPLDLRFEPKRGLPSYVRREVELSSANPHTSLSERLELLAELFSASAARFLSAFALVSTLAAAIAVAYGIYAIAVISFATNVQPGWFSTAIALSGATAFLSFGLAVIALGIASLINRADRSSKNEVVEEIGKIAVYDPVDKLNVEYAASQREQP